MNKHAVIFDLDGTLIDSLKDIALCTNKVLSQLNFPTHQIEKYKEFVGDGAKVLLKNALPNGVDEDTLNSALNEFKKIYSLAIHNNTKPYDGIYELLGKLENYNFKLGVLSNKPHEFTLKYMESLFNQFDFDEIHGQKEGIPKKPNPVGAVYIAEKFKIPTDKIFFVGDTSTDMKTAKAAGMIAVGVLWGFRDENELRQSGADHIVRTPVELLEILL